MRNNYPIVQLKKGKNQPFEYRHPWLFSGAIAKIEGNPQPGEEVKVVSADGSFIAWGLYNPHSQIRVRLYSFEEDKRLTEEFWLKKLENAVAYRKTINYQFGNNRGFRLVNSEGDGLSGLTVDFYGDTEDMYFVVQFTSLALYQYKDIFLNFLKNQFSKSELKGIIIRTEQNILKEEGLQLQDSVIYGTAPDNVLIEEDGAYFWLDIRKGQKTGFYLDQALNRNIIRPLVKGKKVWDICCYNGGFAIHAALSGAERVYAIDISESAIQLAQKSEKYTAQKNNRDLKIIYKKEDMFTFLDKNRSDESVDVIILDPPKMTHSKSSVKNAIDGYIHLHSKALPLLSSNGLLISCCCTGRISRDAFLLAIHTAAVQTKRNLRIVSVRGAAPDHPISSDCPESDYLKCVIAYVD